MATLMTKLRAITVSGGLNIPIEDSILWFNVIVVFTSLPSLGNECVA